MWATTDVWLCNPPGAASAAHTLSTPQSPCEKAHAPATWSCPAQLAAWFAQAHAAAASCAVLLPRLCPANMRHEQGPAPDVCRACAAQQAQQHRGPAGTTTVPTVHCINAAHSCKHQVTADAASYKQQAPACNQAAHTRCTSCCRHGYCLLAAHAFVLASIRKGVTLRVQIARPFNPVQDLARQHGRLSVVTECPSEGTHADTHTIAAQTPPTNTPSCLLTWLDSDAVAPAAGVAPTQSRPRSCSCPAAALVLICWVLL